MDRPHLTWFTAPAGESDFEAIYRAELPRVYNFFRFRVGDGPVAEDLTSATFEKAWRHRDRYRKDLAAFSTWLFTIARRVAIDAYRQPPAALSLEAGIDPPAGENLEEQVEQQDDFARLSTLLARLDGRDRELVALKYGAGLTNRAIAHLTGLTESNVGVILHRTIQAIRSDWEATL